MKLEDRSRVAVVGGGPAGSMCAFFLKEFADRAGLDLTVHIYEPRDFNVAGPAGCNMCGGIVSESLVQTLAAEGINLPPNVIQRGIESYTMHTDVGSTVIATPLAEKRIAAMHRGAGPRKRPADEWQSFDDFLFMLAIGRGAEHRPVSIKRAERRSDQVWLGGRDGDLEAYDLAVVATGVNTGAIKLLGPLAPEYRPPTVTRTAIREFAMDSAAVRESLGDSMHVYLVDIPGLEFAAIIPKGNCASLCLLAEESNDAMVRQFIDQPEVRGSLAEGWTEEQVLCHCSPKMQLTGGRHPYGDRVVFIGDAGVARLYKDGIGAGYRTAKAAATTAVFHGVGEEEFAAHFAPTCDRLARDNAFGRIVFLVTGVIKKLSILRRGVLRMVRREQADPHGAQRMSSVLWDTFTGSAPYRDVFMRTLHPAFLFGFLGNSVAALFERAPETTIVSNPQTERTEA